ncbi:MAG: hypothetical protein ABT01_04160 [Clostridium sp. SCN 57-10]|nr:MAG: hypothetical protein ABT01_04160 [Clostridium sp. SCN 57-10]
MDVHCDLHIHSCLSPCGDADMTPNNIVNMALLCGLDLIALTDHGSCGNCRAIVQAGARAGLSVVPGMELNCREETHVLCLFPDADAAEAFGRYVYERLPAIPNDPAVFGPQLLLDASDRLLGEEPRLLITAADIGVYEVQALCAAFSGVAVPAHLNKSAYSILSSLGYCDPAMDFRTYEITASCREELLVSEHPELCGARFVKNSDAHYLEQIGLCTHTLSLCAATAEALIEYLRR